MIKFLLGKIAGPIFLALAIILAAGLLVQTVRLNGVAIFGWYAIDGYRPMYERLEAQKEADELASVVATLDLAKKQGAAMATENHRWLVAQDAYQLRTNELVNEAKNYVPKAFTVACVPLKLAVYLDAASSGAPESELTAAAAISDSACSNIRVPDAVEKFVRNSRTISVLGARIEAARSSWEEQQRLINEAN